MQSRSSPRVCVRAHPPRPRLQLWTPFCFSMHVRGGHKLCTAPNVLTFDNVPQCALIPPALPNPQRGMTSALISPTQNSLSYSACWLSSGSCSNPNSNRLVRRERCPAHAAGTLRARFRVSRRVVNRQLKLSSPSSSPHLINHQSNLHPDGLALSKKEGKKK